MLKSFLNKFPQLNRLLLAGDNFIMKLLKVPEGFEYLKSMDWVDNEIQQWREETMFEYPERVDRCIQEALNVTSTTSRSYGSRIEDLPHKVLRFNMPMFEFSSDL